MERSYVTININTGINDVASMFMPEFDESEVKVANLVDPEKIRAKKAQAYMIHKSMFEKDCALNAETGQVLVISYKEKDKEPEHVYIGSNPFIANESDILIDFWSRVKEIYQKGWKVITHNGKSFDFYFCTIRSFINNVIPVSYLDNGKWYPDWIVDTKDLWFQGISGWETKGKRWSLNFICQCLGYPQKPFEGKYFGKYWEKDRDLALQYCTHEVNVTERIYKRLTTFEFLGTGVTLDESTVL